LPEKVKNKELLTFGKNHVLVEFAFQGTPSYEDELFFDMLSADYQPVLAHFERYGAFYRNVDKAAEYRDKGVLIQMNLNSLTGHYGPQIKKQAELLIDKGLVDFVGTDCHRIQHLRLLEDNLHLPYLSKLNHISLRNGLL
jgi:protein-tyrosine phosphatase